ncbi:MAG: acyl-CoA dehydrogenase family protein [Rhodopila sp.]|nr:acyl-CoA dehydrogenase family protein [Rhodopila sp.]
MSHIQSAAPYLTKAAELRAIFAKDAVERDKQGGRPLEQLRLLKQSHLLSVNLPVQYGGAGQPWSTVFRIVREFAKADGALGHLFGYHTLALNNVALRGNADDTARLYHASARNDWFWGNAGNAMSDTVTVRRDGEHVVLNGYRPFTSGSHIADIIQLSWTDEIEGKRVFAAVPADRKGITALNDWDGIGQRQTGSGTVTFDNVHVHSSEILGTDANRGKPFSTLTPLIQQSVLLNVFIGSAQGALAEARDYTVTKSRPCVDSGAARHIDDPWIQRLYGDLFIKTEAATLLADKALDAFDRVWARGHDLTEVERGDAAATVAGANVLAGETALDVTSRVFEGMGARSAVTAYGFDRFWRNVRTHSLHNPAEYKTRNVGQWLLTGDYLQPGIYR